MHEQGTQSDILEGIAISNSSPVAKAASVLMSINNVASVIDVCLTCASNFGGSLKGTAAENDSTVAYGWAHQSSSILPWELGLYHGNSDSKKQLSANTNSTTFSQTQVNSPAHTIRSGITNQAIIVSGVEVTSVDARKSCYSIILFHLGELLRAPLEQQRQLGETMLVVATNSCDEMFLQSLFSFLVNQDFIDILLRIQSPRLESWLIEEKQDCTLLWRYYVFHEQHIAAADVMYRKASTDSNTITLNERIECLTRAVNSLRSATENVSSGEYIQKLGDVEEQLDIACLQQRIVSAVIENDLSPRNQIDLETRLLGVSELYNSYAGPLGLYEICLFIIQTCKRKDPTTIETLWRSILSKELAMSAKSSAAQNVLKRLRDGTPLSDMQEMNTSEYFEDGKWISRIKEIVVTTGKELYGRGADYTFPLFLLASTLEGELLKTL